MRGQREQPNDLTRALERQVEMQAQAAKRAIREYNKSLLETTSASKAKRIERQRELEKVMRNYLQLRKRLDELCAEAKRRAR
ncbi:MAG TPA: hypothetical protein VKN18_24795 [Blastocatellia bacterium]|nr:hypothetical protein [Blastocatellia bacterium]